MPEAGMLGRRQIERLADGVRRDRLLAPVIAARPSILVISAPSGYGKTTLAAQIATAGPFELVCWLDAMGAQGSLGETLLGLMGQLGDPHPPMDRASIEELADGCASLLAALPDATRVAVVIDDVGWPMNEGNLRVLETVSAEAPPGSMVIAATRCDVQAQMSSGHRWALRSTDLLLDRGELRSLWGLVNVESRADGHGEWLEAYSGGHAALALLQARQAALTGGSPPQGGQVSRDVVDAVNALATQLDDTQTLVLLCAAVLGDGPVAQLSRCVGFDAHEAIQAVASAIPLVTVADSACDARFAVHALLTEATDADRRLAHLRPGVLQSTVEELCAAGRQLKAVQVAEACDSLPLISRALETILDATVIAEHTTLLRDALSRLSPLELAAKPALMLLHARLQWEEGRLAEAAQTASMAARLADHTDEPTLATRARVALLRMRSASGEYEGLAAEVNDVLRTRLGDLDVETALQLATSGVFAFALLGDRDGLNDCVALAHTIRSGSTASELTLSRLDVALGLSLGVFGGSWPESVEAFQRALERLRGVGTDAALTMHNLSVALMEKGDFEQAEANARDALAVLGGASREGVGRLAAGMLATARAVRAEGGSIGAAWSEALRIALQAGDKLSACLIAESTARAAMLAADRRVADEMADQAVDAALHTGSPVLTWLAELARAQVDLLIGQDDRARSIAERVLLQAEAVGAAGHVLRARLALAVLAIRRGSRSDVAEHVRAVREYVIRKSPALTVASYLRSFPELLGPLVAFMGVEALPISVLGMLRGPRAEVAVATAASQLSNDEFSRLIARLEEAGVTRDSVLRDLTSEAGCHVHLFGGLEVITPKGKVGDRDWTKRKARLLFAMLVARFGTDVPRGEIIDYLWPDMDEERSLNNFYVVWSAMKRALSPDSLRDTPCPFVEHVHGVCRIVRENVVSDLDEFRDLLAEARMAREIGDGDGELKALRAAESIYRGDVLPGDVYDDWFATVRDRYRHDFEDAMLRLAQLCLERNEPHDGLAVLRRVTSPEMWREDLFQALLRLQIAAGQRSAAIETYMRCRARLTEDLGIDPSRETTALYEQVLGMEEQADLVAD